MLKKPVKPQSAEKFKTKEGQYVFPFVALDKTPGGKNLGRIQWCIELHPQEKSKESGFRRVGKLLVWAMQTRDKRYFRKVFEIPTFAEMFYSCASTNKRDAFVPWKIMLCDEHKGAVVLDAYPENEHRALVIDAMSSIMVQVKFRA